MLWSVWIQCWYACNLPIPLWFHKSQPCWGKWKGQPTKMEMPGSYLMSDSILPNTLSAGLLGDTAAIQHDLVLGTEAAFWGVVPTGASVPVTVPRAATLTVVIHQGRWARHSCKQRIRSFSVAYTSQKQKKHPEWPSIQQTFQSRHDQSPPVSTLFTCHCTRILASAYDRSEERIQNLLCDCVQLHD